MCLYVHIPFCERRCAFCEYTVMDNHDEDLEIQYHQALLQELDLYMVLLGTENKELGGLDIGGGTPSLINPKRIGELVERVAHGFRLSPGFGISIETTPKIAATLPGRLTAYRAFGIERISMGLQMVNPKLLREYERDINKIGYNHRAVENIRRAGFRRFNIDLMYGFAKQSPEDFRRTLEYTIRLQPEYITLYRMRYKGTRISDEARDIELKRVVEMYQMARKFLTSAGYQANPGKNGFSRVIGDPGTSEYLTERVVRSTSYLGLGLGAQTFTNNLLAYNHGAAPKRMERYLRTVKAGELPIQDLYHLPLSEAMAKMISVSFYFGQIHLGAFRYRFGMELEERFTDEIAFVLDRGFMEYRRQTLRLTSKGAKVFNGVIALFYSNRVKEYLLSIA
jgi:oxygen-independent coproporphyrinogen-3 oxidase